ncbi:RHS repeat domain-containing protein [Reichenbachiella sp.]|uniref:RHS repeat protein n=1 Tax=Reichenbachiella sp. TaxID=2184521 RepID=UPI0032973596
MKKLIYLYTLALLLPLSIQAQSVSTGYNNFLPPSPSAGASGASGDGLAHGMTGASIPLANFATNQLSVPVSLSYYSTGTKVDQLASNVGLGWSLQAGGVITRTVRDHRDEVSTAVYPTDITDFSDNTVRTFIANALDETQTFDTEPDLFSFSFMGYSGSFVFDANDVIRVMPYQNLHFETNDSLDYFHVTTAEGIRYEFGGAGAVESSKSSYSGAYCQSSSSYDDFVKTAWYLKKIVHPLGDAIDFEYEANFYSYQAGRTQTEYYNINPNVGGNGFLTCQTYSPEKCDVNIEINEVQLTKISATHFGSIAFTNSTRVSVGNKILDQVIIKDANDAVLRKLNLTYHYTNGDRMFLSQFTATDKNDVQEAVHAFDYHKKEELPARLFGEQDHWGYYRGGYGISSHIVPKYDVAKDGTSPNYGGWFDALGIDRSPDGNYAKYGMLESIVYPSSMFTLFEYEPNRLAVGTETGGLRLAKITNQDPVTEQQDVTNYHYGPVNNPTGESGRQYIEPNFWSYFSLYTNKMENPNNACEFFECKYASLQSNSLNSLFNTGGQHITYQYVTIGKGVDFDNGATQYTYLIEDDTLSASVYGEKINGLPLTNKGWDNGLLNTVSTYKKDAQGNFIMLQLVDHNYFPDTRLQTATPGAVIRKTLVTPCDNIVQLTCTAENSQQEFLVFCRAIHTHNYSGSIGECIAQDNDNDIKLLFTPPCYGHVGEQLTLYYEMENVDIMEYQNHSFWYYLQSSTTSQYDEDGNNPVTSTVTYHYDEIAHAQLTSVDSDASIEGTITTSYTYPQDYGTNGAAVIDKMVDKHLTGIPVETVKTVGSTVVSAGATKFVYDATNDWVIPEAFYAYEDTGGGYVPSPDGTTFSSYTKKGEVLARDSKGQVISQRAENNVVSTVIRGYNQTLVVASITNATAAEVQTALPMLGSDLSAGVAALGASDINTLKSALPQALITAYTYKIGFGVETMTDPNGRTTSYEYDAYGRVKYVKDHDGNIRSASDYQNKSQISN